MVLVQVTSRTLSVLIRSNTPLYIYKPSVNVVQRVRDLYHGSTNQAIRKHAGMFTATAISNLSSPFLRVIHPGRLHRRHATAAATATVTVLLLPLTLLLHCYCYCYSTATLLLLYCYSTAAAAVFLDYLH